MCNDVMHVLFRSTSKLACIIFAFPKHGVRHMCTVDRACNYCFRFLVFSL